MPVVAPLPMVLAAAAPLAATTGVGHSYSLQSIAVIGVVVVVGVVLIRRRAERRSGPHGGGRRGAGSRPTGTAPPPGINANRWERPPTAPPGPQGGPGEPDHTTGSGPGESPPTKRTP